MQVRVILDRRARSVNSDAYSYLRSHRVAVTWSSPDYHYFRNGKHWSSA